MARMLALLGASIAVAIPAAGFGQETQQQMQAKVMAAAESPITYERAIINLKAKISQLQAAMARERRAGQISGYVNAASLHDAGLAIAQCQDNIERTYAQYRAQGGHKPLAAIAPPLGYQYRPSPFDY